MVLYCDLHVENFCDFAWISWRGWSFSSCVVPLVLCESVSNKFKNHSKWAEYRSSKKEAGVRRVYHLLYNMLKVNYFIVNDRVYFIFEICIIVFCKAQSCEGHDTHSAMFRIYSKQVSYHHICTCKCISKICGNTYMFVCSFCFKNMWCYWGKSRTFQNSKICTTKIYPRAS